MNPPSRPRKRASGAWRWSKRDSSAESTGRGHPHPKFILSGGRSPPSRRVAVPGHRNAGMESGREVTPAGRRSKVPVPGMGTPRPAPLGLRPVAGLWHTATHAVSQPSRIAGEEPDAAQYRLATSSNEHDWRLTIGGNSYGLLQRVTYFASYGVGGIRTTTICLGPYTANTRLPAAYVAAMMFLPVGATLFLLARLFPQRRGA